MLGVAALQAVVDGETKADDGYFFFICPSCLWGEQLLKLNGIAADGEGRVQRKMEVSIRLP